MKTNELFRSLAIDAKNYVSRGKVLTPKPGTVLEAVNRPLYPITKTTAMNAVLESLQADEDMMDYIDNRDILVPHIAKKLNEMLSFTRQVVLPFSRELEETIKKRIENTHMSEIGIAEQIGNYHIVQINADTGTFSTSTNATVSEKVFFPADAKFPELTDEELNAVIVSGDENLDSSIRRVLSENQINFGTIYHNVFLKPSDAFVQDLARGVIGNYDKLKGLSVLPFVLAAIHVMSLRFLKELPDGIQGDYGRIVGFLQALHAQTGLALQLHNENQDNNISNGRLIVEIKHKPGEHNIYVDKQVYDKYLQQGGAPDAVLGALVASEDGPSNYSMMELLSKQDYFRDLWNQKYNQLTSSNSFKRTTWMRRTFRDIFGELVQSRLIANNIVPEQGVDDPGTIMLEAGKMLDMLTVKEMTENTNMIALRMTLLMFPKDVADLVIDIQNSLDEAAANNRDLEPREAALMAAVRYVANWVVNEIGTGFQGRDIEE